MARQGREGRRSGAPVRGTHSLRRTTHAELRAKDRALMSEHYRKEKNSEVGLGDLVLEAHDRAV